jgi:glyoxylase-like metal-dependent hydrolase (beta-lactamase superfamily II)
VHCALLDSVLDYDPKSGRTSTRSADHLIERVQALGAGAMDPETHAHADHLSAAPYLKRSWAAASPSASTSGRCSRCSAAVQRRHGVCP